MSDVLNELREAMQRDIDATPHGRAASDLDNSYIEGVSDALLRLAAYEAAHPGLVDRTIHCTECGAPGPEFPPRGWTGVWVPDDGEHFRCPTCAGKEKP